MLSKHLLPIAASAYLGFAASLTSAATIPMPGDVSDTDTRSENGDWSAPTLTIQATADTWGGLPIEEDVHVNTQTGLGWLNISLQPWMWSYDRERWFYVPEPEPSHIGIWSFIPYNRPVPQAAAPAFSPVPGAYPDAQTVTLSSTDAGATIRYTTDGSLPTVSSGTVYESPISVDETTEIKAIAYGEGLTESAVAAALYTIAGTGTTYYVDPAAGSMSNAGTAEAPWSTLEAVLESGKTFNPGDIIYLRSGQHGFPVVRSVNTASVTIRAESGHSPVLTQIDFRGARHWILQGVSVHSDSQPPQPAVLEHPVYPQADNFLIRVLDNSRNITIRDCYVFSAEDSSGWTVADWNNKAWNGMDINETRDILVENCHFKNVNFGIRIQGGAPYTTVRSSLIENYCGDGMKMNASNCVVEYTSIINCYDTNGNHDDAIQCQGSTSNGVLRGNYILNYTDPNQPHKGTLQGLALFAGPYHDWVIENNVIVVNHYHGITINHPESSNAKVINNTVVDQEYTGNPGPTWISAQGIGHVVRNNLATDVNAGGGTIVNDHNIEIKDGNFAAHFVNYPFDLHLKSDSPAVDGGSSEGAPALDFDGTPRDSTPDVGAYEYTP